MVSPRREQTRRKLVTAATKVVARNGFHGASVAAIAKRAGFSVGALYSNFEGKDELFFAVFDGHVAWFEEHLAAAAAAADPASAISEWMGELGRDPDQFLIFVEFWAYAVRRTAVRKQLAKRLAEMRTRVAEILGDENSALLALATARGLAIEKLADPNAVSDSTMAALAGLVGLNPVKSPD